MVKRMMRYWMMLAVLTCGLAVGAMSEDGIFSARDAGKDATPEWKRVLGVSSSLGGSTQDWRKGSLSLANSGWTLAGWAKKSGDQNFYNVSVIRSLIPDKLSVGIADDVKDLATGLERNFGVTIDAGVLCVKDGDKVVKSAKFGVAVPLNQNNSPTFSPEYSTEDFTASVELRANNKPIWGVAPVFGKILLAVSRDAQSGETDWALTFGTWPTGTKGKPAITLTRVEMGDDAGTAWSLGTKFAF